MKTSVRHAVSEQRLEPAAPGIRNSSAKHLIATFDVKEVYLKTVE